MARKECRLDNQQPSREQRKVQRLSLRGVAEQAIGSAKRRVSLCDKDIVHSPVEIAGGAYCPAGSSVPDMNLRISHERQLKRFEVMKVTNEMVGKKYGMLRVLSMAPDRISLSGRKEKMCMCECDCGNVKLVRASCLKNGNTKSCGCYRSQCSSERMAARSIHGLGGTKLYHVWQNMIDRCQNPKHKSYKNYGANGIHVCDQWLSVTAFADWAFANGYREGLTLERIDNAEGYSPDNCIWADRYVQNNHTSRNHLLTYMGKTQSMAQWARELNISYAALKTRINRLGWPVEVALSTPVA